MVKILIIPSFMEKKLLKGLKEAHVFKKMFWFKV